MNAQPASKPKNIEFKPLPDLSWDPVQRSASLQMVADYVAAEAVSAIAWYRHKKASKQLTARILRFLVIAATALAWRTSR